ncbi:uncharacterized protein G2W53_000876 [Senna tora]|uniref:Uncharacterized protein n=1 Tax=Senna tora TaxID=362788 RepID=A0A835CI42_9FABA|nr:uncharacterized protein G2W53_000876 [Senna tora]
MAHSPLAVVNWARELANSPLTVVNWA